MHDRRRAIWIGGLLLGVVVAAIYSRTLPYEALSSWDDEAYLFNRPTVRHWWSTTWFQRLRTPDMGYPIPVPTFLYAHLRWLAPELYPHTVRALQIGLHLLNIGLVWGLVRRWHPPVVAGSVAALWGLHPICVEAVVWLSNLKTALAVSCMLGSMWIWEIDLQSQTSSAPPHRGRTLAMVVLFGLALGCRPDAAILPILWAGQMWRHLDTEAYAVARIALLGTTGTAAVAYALLAQSLHATTIEYSPLNRDGVSPYVGRILESLELAVRHLVLPIELHPEYTSPGSFQMLEHLPGLMIAVALAGLTVTLVSRAAWDLLVALGWASLSYLPGSNIVPLPQLASDTYLYMPAIGAMLFVVLGMRRLVEALEGRSARRLRVASIALFGAVLLAWTGQTLHQTTRWRNLETLWRPVLRAHPQSPRPYHMIARHHARHERWERSAEMLERGLPLFRRQHYYPIFMPEVFDYLGDSRRAANLATEALLEEVEPDDAHYKVWLEVMARHEYALPDVPNADELLQTAVQRYASRPHWLSRRDSRLSIVDYLTQRGHLELARPLLEYEFRTEQPHCFAWRALSRYPEPRRRTFDASPPPDRCLE